MIFIFPRSYQVQASPGKSSCMVSGAVFFLTARKSGLEGLLPVEVRGFSHTRDKVVPRNPSHITLRSFQLCPKAKYRKEAGFLIRRGTDSISFHTLQNPWKVHQGVHQGKGWMRAALPGFRATVRGQDSGSSGIHPGEDARHRTNEEPRFYRRQP